MWSHLERQVPKHQDPPPLQHHKRGVHHCAISAWLVRPCGAYGRRSYSQGSLLWTAGRVSLVRAWSERCKDVFERNTEGVQHWPNNMDSRGCEPVKMALDLSRWYSPLRGQPHSPPDRPTWSTTGCSNQPTANIILTNTIISLFQALCVALRTGKSSRHKHRFLQTYDSVHHEHLSLDMISKLHRNHVFVNRPPDHLKTV